MIEFFTETLSLGGIATTKKIKFFTKKMFAAILNTQHKIVAVRSYRSANR